MTIGQLLAFNLALLVAIASPGPALPIAIGTTLSGGRSAGIAVGAGLGLMAATWTLMALLGLGIALLEHDTRQDQDDAQFRAVKGLCALVPGHWPVEEVVPTVNRWNTDTGAGSARLDRLIFLEVNSQVLRSWTFDVDEFRVPGSAERIRLPPPVLRRRHGVPVR